MNGSTHAALTKAVVEALKWSGDCNLVSRNAIYPDASNTIEIGVYGNHLFGLSLASLVHFLHPVGGGKFEGYCWQNDPSVIHFDLGTSKVIPKPENWGFPVADQLDLITQEPLAKLVRDLTGHASIQADELTYNSASAMAEWMHNCYRILAKRLTGDQRRQALDVLAGWQFHVGAGDPAVPQHVMLTMLDGHAAFEGDVDEQFKVMASNGELAKWIDTFIKADNAPEGLTIRAIAEQTATTAVVSPCKLGWYRSVYRHGWNKLVKQCVIRGTLASVRIGKVLMREAA